MKQSVWISGVGVGGAKGRCTWQLDRSGDVLPQKISDILGVTRCYQRHFGTIFNELFLYKYLSGSKVIVDVKNLLILVLIMFIYQNLSTSHLVIVNLQFRILMRSNKTLNLCNIIIICFLNE